MIIRELITLTPSLTLNLNSSPNHHDNSIDPLSIAGFARMKALSQNNIPKESSRPFDSKRDGFVMAEGAGIVILEELTAAQSRGANIIAEVIGYGLSGDAHHPTHPSEEGSGAERSMRQALDDASIGANDIGVVNIRKLYLHASL
jgi:3-oxoacyl-[acyl-carrier-protein] synthase II